MQGAETRKKSAEMRAAKGLVSFSRAKHGPLHMVASH